MTATAVLARTNIADGAASPSSPPLSGDEEYARQLNRRLADDRSSAPRTANAPRADTASRAIGLSNHPIVSVVNDRGEEVTAEAPGDSRNAQGVLNESLADPAVSSAPPFPWHQNAAATVEPQRPSDAPQELPPTAKAPASPHAFHHGHIEDAAIPQGLVRANEVTTASSRGVVAPPGLVVAFDAVQQRSASPPANPTVSDAGSEASSEASGDETKSPQPVTPSAPSAATTIATASPTTGLADEALIVRGEQPAATEGDSTADQAASSKSFDVATGDVTQQVSVETASIESTLVEAVEAATVETKSQIDASEPGSVGSSTESTDQPVADQPQHVANQHRKAIHGPAHAADVVADATARAVEAVASSPAAPAAGGRASSPTQAVPIALHASLIERAIDAADVPSPPSTDSAANVAADTGVSSLRHAAKLPATPPGETIRIPHLPEADLADGLPRHAAAALRAAAGFDRPIRIRLSPAELGALQVEVGRHEGSLHARFEVTTPAAQAMLHDHLSALRESLGRAGVTVDRIDVRLVETTPDEGRADSQQQSSTGSEQGGHGGQEHEQPRREHRGKSGRDSDLDVTPRPSGDSVSPHVEGPGRNALNHAADLLDIQV